MAKSAQFHFLGSDKDTFELIENILQNENLYLIPDMCYKTPEPQYFKTFNGELQEILTKYRICYLTSPDFSSAPPTFMKLDKGSELGNFIVDPNTGGPFLTLYLPPCFPGKKDLNLAYGVLSYSSFTRDFLKEEFVQPSLQIKTAYKALKNQIKKLLVHHTIESQKVWIGKHALHLLEIGKARIEVNLI